MFSMIRSAALGLCAFAGVAAGPAFADVIPYPNSGSVAPAASFSARNTGDLIAYFYGSTASYEELLGLQVNGFTVRAGVLDNQNSSPGQSYNFGHVTAGDVLTFFINVIDSGDVWYSDPTVNADGVNHTYTTTYTGGVAGIPEGTFVGFEDLPDGQADFNYNDETFVFTNTVSSVPLPASAPMFGAALLALGAVGYGLKRKKAFLAA